MSLRETLQSIYDQRGALTPALVVAEASNPHHPLHSRFEWDDSIAGEKWRETQAAQIIRSVKITYSEDPQRDVRAFLAVKRDPTDEFGIRSSYEPTDAALADPITRAILLRDMERDWKLFRSRYSHLQEYVDLLERSAAENRSEVAS